MAKPIVLVTHPDTPVEAINLLKEKYIKRICININNNCVISIFHIRCEVIVCSTPTREEILEKVKGVSGILWSTPKVRLDAEILDAAGNFSKTLIYKIRTYLINC